MCVQLCKAKAASLHCGQGVLFVLAYKKKVLGNSAPERIPQVRTSRHSHLGGEIGEERGLEAFWNWKDEWACKQCAVAVFLHPNGVESLLFPKDPMMHKRRSVAFPQAPTADHLPGEGGILSLEMCSGLSKERADSQSLSF